MTLIVWTSDKEKNVKKYLQPLLNTSGVDYRIEDVPEDLIALPQTGPGDLLLAMGKRALDHLALAGITQKGRSITSMRCPKLFKMMSTGANAMVTFTAGMVEIDYARHVDTMIDVAMAIRLLKTGSFAPKVGKYRWVDDFSDIVADIEAQFAKTGKPVKVGFDTETLGLDCWNPKAWLISIQVSTRKGFSDLVYFPTREQEQAALSPSSKLWEQLNFILTSPKVRLRGANGKYDVNWIYRRTEVAGVAINCTRLKFDTMIVGSLLDENRANSLNLHAKVYLPELGGYDDEFNAKYDKARMDLVPKDDLLIYAGGDSDAVLQVADIMEEKLMKDPALARFYVTVLHPAVRAYEQVERCGMCVDVPYYLSVEAEAKQEKERLHKEGWAILGGKLRAKHFENQNLGKSSMLIDFFFSPYGLNLKPQMFTAGGKEGKGPKLPSTAMNHLMMFENDPRAAPFLEVLREYERCEKVLNTYIAKRDEDGRIVGGFLSHLRSDGRFHPSYFLAKGDTEDGEDEAGTDTGRTSAKDPAVQTIPKHKKGKINWAKKLRMAFIAPPGMVVASRDYSQGELKIAACLANEEHMIQAYLDGIDLHVITASRLAGYTLEAFMELKKTNEAEYDEIRQLGKAGNFGLIYGMAAVPGFQNYAKWNYGVTLTEEEANDARNGFFELYPGLTDWHKEYKGLAREQGYIRSPLGRVRHLPLIYSPDKQAASKAGRQAINSPVQGTLSDMTLWATSLMWKAGWFVKTPGIGMIHDQTLSYVPEQDALKYAARDKYLMENLPFHKLGWKPQLQFTVDAEYGPTLGSMNKCKGLTYDQAGELLADAKAALAG